MGKVKGGAECSVCSSGCCFPREHGSQKGRGIIHTPSATASQFTFLWGPCLALCCAPCLPSLQLALGLLSLCCSSERRTRGGVPRRSPKEEHSRRETSRSSSFSHSGAMRHHECHFPKAQGSKGHEGPPSLSSSTVRMKLCPRLSPASALFSLNGPAS